MATQAVLTITFKEDVDGGVVSAAESCSISLPYINTSEFVDACEQFLGTHLHTTLTATAAGFEKERAHAVNKAPVTEPENNG